MEDTDRGIETGFDLQKLFHMMKPVNPEYGNKNPTLSSNSWGYRANKREVRITITLGAVPSAYPNRIAYSGYSPWAHKETRSERRNEDNPHDNCSQMN